MYSTDVHSTDVQLTPSDKEESQESIERHRATDPWTKRIEAYIAQLKDTARFMQEQHDAAASRFQRLHNIWGLPAILVPSISAPLAVLLDFNANGDCSVVTTGHYLSTSALIVTTALTVVNSFFKFEKRSKKHALYSTKYADLVTDISTELIKKQKFRMPADVFVSQLKMKYDSLVTNEPSIPSPIVRRKRVARNASDEFDEVV